MSLDLQWTVLNQPHLPAKWKHALTVLALIAKDDGTSIFASEETLSGYLGMHRVTTHYLLRELHDAGLVVVTRRGGRWRTSKGVRRRCSERSFDLDNLRAFRCSPVTTSCSDLVAPSLQAAPDLVATGLHAEPDLVAPWLQVKTGKNLKTGRNSKGTGRMTVGIASDADVSALTSPSTPSQQQQQKTKEPV